MTEPKKKKERELKFWQDLLLALRLGKIAYLCRESHRIACFRLSIRLQLKGPGVAPNG